LVIGTLAAPEKRGFGDRGRLLAALAISFLSLLGARLAFVPLYQSNDDVTMRLMAEGVALTSRPTPYLLFINILLGKVMVWLHDLAPSISWFVVTLALIHLAGTATIVWTALRGGSLVQAMVFLTAFDFWFWVKPHFTMTAAVAAIGAVVLWIDQVTRGQPLRGWYLVWFLMLVTLSSLVRWQSCGLILIAAFPAIVLESMPALRLRAGRYWLSVLVLPVLYAAFAGQGVKAINDWIYRADPGWAEFEEFNRVRAEFTDFERAPYGWTTVPALHEAGMTYNDYKMLRSWAFEDPERFSLPVLRKLAKELPPATGSPWDALRRRWIEGTVDPAAHLVVGALVVSLVLAEGGRRKRMAIALVTVIGVSLVVGRVYHRFPHSLSEPLAALVPALGTAGDTASTRSARAKRLLYTLGFGLLGILFARVCLVTIPRAKAVQAMSDRLVEAIHDLRPQSDELYVDWGGSFPYELLLGSGQIREVAPMRILALGCANQTPINRERLREFHIDNLFQAIFERKNIRVIGYGDTITQIARYADDHYGKSLRFRKLMHRRLGEYPSIDENTGRTIMHTTDLVIFDFKESRPEP
jgi:hypothetical protein